MENENFNFTRSRLTWAEKLQVGDVTLSCAQICSSLAPHLTEERKLRLEQVVDQRSLHLATVLENIYDRGNISAVMRSCEAFGFLNVNLVDAPQARFKAANRITRGADKWLDVKTFHQPLQAVASLRAQGYQIWATDLNTDDSIEMLDWSKPVAIVLGNEKEGVSQEMLNLVDGRFRIPMLGFSQSFNISVAAALIFYHAYLELRKLESRARLSPQQREQVLANYYLRCFDNPAALLKAKGFI